MSIKKGDIVFVCNDGIFSHIIRLVESGKFNQSIPSHCAIVMSVYSNKVMLIEANYLKGVRLVSLDTYNNQKCWFARMKEPRDIQKGLEWLNERIGTRYDIMQLIGIFARGFFRLLGKKVYNKVRFIRNFLNSKQKFICSELVEIYAGITGKRLWKGSIGLVTPYDLFRSDKIEIYDEG